MLTNTHKIIIKQHALESSPKECCGLILNDNQLIKCENVSDFPETRFAIDNNVVNKIGLQNINAFYHSHDYIQIFSIADIAFSEKLQKICYLYICHYNLFKEYIPGGMLVPYVGRTFFQGTLDCFTLVQDYYRRELNLSLSDLEHPERYNRELWKNPSSDDLKKYDAHNILKTYFINNKFVEVNNLKKHDIILTKMPEIPFPIHVMIYLDNNRVLQHMHELSEITPYSNAMKRLTCMVMRHKYLL